MVDLAAWCSLASELFNKLAQYFVDIIPIAFLGRSDPSDECRKLFDQVWNEVGITQPQRLYIQEVIALLKSCLSSNSWVMKAQSARAIADLCTTATVAAAPVR